MRALRTSAIAVAACGVTLAGGAMAADLPSRIAAPAPYIAAAPLFTWTGFYVGALAGASFSDGNNNNVTFTPGGLPNSPNLNPAIGNTNNVGFTGGGEIGYNWQVSSFVLGIEGDIDYLSRRNNENGTFASPNNGPGTPYTLFPTYSLSGANSNKVFGTIRGRLGYAMDRTLFFVTGGAAFGGNRSADTITFMQPNGVACNTCTFTATNGNNNSNVGAVVGGGIEYAFTNNFTAKVEYLRTLYGNQNNSRTYTNTINQTFTRSGGSSQDTNIVRVGLNYKF